VSSNGVINLVPDKARAFAAAARALRDGGRLAIADIVSARTLKERTRRNTQLWAACIAGAVPLEEYVSAIEGSPTTSELFALRYPQSKTTHWLATTAS
jgi:arsenite methyltransferase